MSRMGFRSPLLFSNITHLPRDVGDLAEGVIVGNDPFPLFPNTQPKYDRFQGKTDISDILYQYRKTDIFITLALKAEIQQ